MGRKRIVYEQQWWQARTVHPLIRAPSMMAGFLT